MTTEFAPHLAALLAAVRDNHEVTIAVRRRIHGHPEIGLGLPVTQDVVVEELARLGRRPVACASPTAPPAGSTCSPATR